MDVAAVARYARQIALPEVGPEGQTRICAARVLVVGAGGAAETAATYLRAAGVAEVLAREAAPADGGSWLAALAGVDLVVRVGFDDDAMLGATKRLGLPVVVARATPEQVDLISFPRRAPAPQTSLDVPAQAAAPGAPGAADVVAGTLAAAEALVRIAGVDGDIGRVRHLRLPLDGGAPVAQELGVA
ncbi:MAG TPA: ThiF family adenylyltransferase [Polyangia bacterium]|nr:ThiF family adenylyltransferase [Polyangia bacterium]